jgi:hypothetical protein
MHTRPQLVAALALLAICVAACGPSPTTEPSPSTDPSTTPSSPPASAAALPSMPPFDHGEIPTDLVGRYTFEMPDQEWSIELAADGTYELILLPLAFGVSTDHVRGEYGVFGDQIRFGNEVSVEGSGNTCPSDGVYTWTFDGTTLAMTVVEDDCPSSLNRVGQWEAGWTRAD